MKGNIGEWSEIFATFRLIESGVLDFSNISQEQGRVNSKVKLRQVVKPLKDYEIVFELRDDENHTDSVKLTKNFYVVPNELDETGRKIIDKTKTAKTALRTRAQFGRMAKALNTFLKSPRDFLTKDDSKRSFNCRIKVYDADNKRSETVSEFLDNLGISGLAADSENKCDLELVYEENGGTRRKRFSVKSQIGSKPTLLNPSAATTIRFKVNGPITKKEADDINGIENPKKYLRRHDAIHKKGFTLSVDKFFHPNFDKNLRRIHGGMAHVIPAMIMAFYGRGSDSKAVTLTRLCEKVKENLSPELKQEYKDIEGDLENHVKDFLYRISTYMRPAEYSAKVIPEVDGGYLEIDKDGTLHGYSNDYHSLAKFLFENTALDTPSSKSCEQEREVENGDNETTLEKVKIGEIYEEKGEFFVNFALQIRFVNKPKLKASKPKIQ